MDSGRLIGGSYTQYTRGSLIVYLGKIFEDFNNGIKDSWERTNRIFDSKNGLEIELSIGNVFRKLEEGFLSFNF